MNMHPEFYCYTLGPPLEVNGREPGVLAFDEQLDVCRIDTDADFEVKRLSCFVTRAGDPQTKNTREIPTGILFNIRDNATGRTLFNGFADTGELFGDGTVPFVLPTSHFFQKGGQAQVLYAPENLQGPDFQASHTWLVMIGAKHFRKG